MAGESLLLSAVLVAREGQTRQDTGAARGVVCRRTEGILPVGQMVLRDMGIRIKFPDKQKLVENAYLHWGCRY